MFHNYSDRKRAILALILANIIWGAASPIFKFSLQNIPPFTLALFRFTIASLILLPFVHKELHRFTNEVRNWKEIVLYSLSGVTINIIFFFLGLKLTESINAPIIGSAGPIVIIIASSFFLKEKITHKKIIGVGTSFAGVVLIILLPLLEKGIDATILGNLFLVLATLGAVGQTLVGRNIASKYSPLPLTFWAFLIGSITFIPFAFGELMNLPPLDYRAFIGIAYGAIFSSALAYSLYAWGLSKIQASEAGLFAYIDPVVAMAIAYPLLGEKPTGLFVIGSLLVFIGIYIAEGRIQYHPINKLFKE